MNKEHTNKYALAVFCLCAAVLSFLYSAYKNKVVIEELTAPVVVNIEVDKAYMDAYRVVAEPKSRVFIPAPAGPTHNDVPHAVVVTEIRGEYVRQLFVQCRDNEAALKAIDHIAVFVGNKTHYFPKDALETGERRETDAGLLLQLPLEPYAASLIKPALNWYGDLNGALKGMTAFLVYPISCSLLLLALALLWKEIEAGVFLLIKKHGTRLEIIMLIALLVFAFLLRINGFTRYSSWGDEFYSSTVAANPHLPVLNAFKDPGNPPLFYLLLRLWHEICGWSEPSGRMLCVVIGTLGVGTLYLFVKSMCGKKCAFLAALLLSINATHIGFSNEIRAYILQMALAPLVSLFFFGLLRKGGFKNYALYMLASAAIVNTHYYGVLLIAFNFIYYIVMNRNQLFVKKTLLFVMANGIIALSLLPFFVMTAFQSALMDRSFNTWIPKLTGKDVLAFIALASACLVFPMVKRRSIPAHTSAAHTSAAQSGSFLDYTIYAGSFIFIAAFLVSLKRVILLWRYLSICLPLLFSILPLAAFHLKQHIKPEIPERFLSVLVSMLLLQCSYGFTLFGGGYYDVYKEGEEYIHADIAAHSLKAARLGGDMSSYYGLEKTPSFSAGEKYDVVYINAADEESAGRTLTGAGLDEKNVLKIKTTDETRSIWKKYVR